MEKPKGKILHSDKEPENSVPTDTKVEGPEFLEKIKNKPTETGHETVTDKKGSSNAWIWVLVVIVVLAATYALVSYAKNKKQNGNV